MGQRRSRSYSGRRSTWAGASARESATTSLRTPTSSTSLRRCRSRRSTWKRSSRGKRHPSLGA
eukprot:1233433-Alexandrium_andersonii.AAC.1